MVPPGLLAPKPKGPPLATPWLLPIAAALILGMAVAYKLVSVKFYPSAGNDLVRVTRLEPSLVKDVASWWKLIASMFVHGGIEQILPCILAISLVASHGIKCERRVGSGAALLIFLVGGVVGNLVRCAYEPAALLSRIGTGGLTGGAALVGGGAALVVRTREGSIASAILGSIFSLAFTIFFAGNPASQAGVDDMKDVVPGIFAAFVTGGFLGTFFPLHDKVGSATKIVFLAVALAILGTASGIYFSKVRSTLRGLTPLEPEDPTLQSYDDKDLGYSYAVPFEYKKAKTEKDHGAVVVYHAPVFSTGKWLSIAVFPADPMAGDGEALGRRVLLELQKQDPDAQATRQGPIEGVSIGRAYRTVVELVSGEQYWCAVARTDTGIVRVILHTSLEDDAASKVLTGVARSLKPRPKDSDK